MKRRALLTLVGAALAAVGAPARADAYPDRPIRLYQGYAPGGNADSIARLLASEMGKTLGQPLVVEAQSGAGGTLAAASVARARPDGYTLLLATGGHSVAGALYTRLPYKTVADFEMISTVTYFPFLIVVNASSKYKTFSELMRAARDDPGAIAFGTAGVGTTHHLAGELLARMAKLQMLHIPYRGDAAALTALLADELPFIITPPTAVMPYIQAGKLRALAATSAQRWSGLPDLPTVAEQGVPGYDVSSWAGLMAPATTPRPIIDLLGASTVKALQIPEVRKRLEEMGGEAQSSTPEAMKAMVAKDVDKWTQVVAAAKIPKQ